LLPVFVLCLLIYGLHAGDFFFHDSAPALQENSAIRISGDSMDDWRTAALSTDSGPLGRPIAMLSFAANHALAGNLDGAVIKTTNALVHILSGVFLYLFLTTVLTRSPVLSLGRDQALITALFATALWLLHPLHVSTVLYAVQRMTQLAALFTFIGLWQVFRLRAAMLEREPGVPELSRILLHGALWTSLAALSKENGLLLPLLAAVTELCLFRFRGLARYEPAARYSVLLMIVGTALVLILFPVFKPETVQLWYAQRDFSFSERILTQPRVLWEYLGWLLLPDIGSMGFYSDDYPLSQSLLAPVTTGIALLAFFAIGIVAWLRRDQLPLLGFALLWFLAGHVLESSIFALEIAYEHRNYVPSVGPLLLLASVPLMLPRDYAGHGRAVLGLFLVVLSVLLFLRSASWESEVQLAEANFRHHPQSVRSRYHLASAYYRAALTTDESEKVRDYLAASRLAALKVLELDPDHIPALVWLVLRDSSSSDGSRIPEWQARIATALQGDSLHVSDVKFIEILNDCVINGRCPEHPGGQEALLRTAYSMHPGRLHLLYQVASYCFEVGRYSCAREAAEDLLQRQPRFFQGYEILYRIETAEGNLGAALEIARRMLAADPERRQHGLLIGQATPAP
jgi:tetratricopeptide (TPR) repeat protein